MVTHQRRSAASKANSKNVEDHHQIEEDGQEKYSSRKRHSLHRTRTVTPKTFELLFGFVFFYVLNFLFIYHRHQWLPPANDTNASQDVFSEGRARKTLEKIMSYGIRTLGSQANEVDVPEYLIKQIQTIRSNAKADIQWHIQRPTGAFGLNFLEQFQNIYANITNIVVRVSPRGASPEVLNNSLLLSSHYDAALGSAAASDDGVSIAIMLELLRLYSLNPPQHASIIFNFNGAEESILPAAHGFITQDPWKETIRAFINLEAAGAGGRELLFQTGSDELALAYARGAKYPYATIVAQEIFQSGVVNSDTDFRVYRDYGVIPGMDYAYVSNGYVYHTSLDVIERIQEGAIQRLGENLVGVIEEIANQPGVLKEIASKSHHSETLFLDLFGYKMISMSRSNSFMISGVILIGTVIFLMSSSVSFEERIMAFKFVAKCTGLALIGSLCTGTMLTLYAPMTWYAQPFLGGATFALPALSMMVHSLERLLEKYKNKLSTNLAVWRLEEALFEASLCFWTAGLMALMYFKVISSYLCAVWVFFPLLGQLICHLLAKFNTLSSWAYVTISLCALAFPVAHSALLLTLALQFFIPLMGRSGTTAPSDLIVGVMFSLALIVLLSYTFRFFCFLPIRHVTQLRKLLVVSSCCVIAYASMCNPYSDMTPKRLWVQHIQREVTSSETGEVQLFDSGLWVNGVDFRGVSSIKSALRSTSWKDIRYSPPQPIPGIEDVYGSLPWFLPLKDHVPSTKSLYLPAEPPIIPEEFKVVFKVVSSTYNPETNHRKIHLFFKGPSQLNLFIDARNITLTSWSVGNGVDGPVPSSDSKTYLLQFSTGRPPSWFHFWIEAESSNPIPVTYVGHHINITTPEIESIGVLPSWIEMVSFASTWGYKEI
jgi:hypothetical protein